MRQCQERSALEDAVVEYLKDHQGLRELNARRRQARLASRLEEDTSPVIQALVRADPTLAALFGKGQKIKVPIGPIPEPEPYVGKQFPTFFRIAREPKAGLVRGCPVNRTCRVEFETDAANDYFSRSADPGHLEVRGAPGRVGTVHLWNGKGMLRFAPPSTCNPGDQLQVHVVVSDVSRVVPFELRFVMEVEPEAPPERSMSRGRVAISDSTWRLGPVWPLFQAKIHTVEDDGHATCFARTRAVESAFPILRAGRRKRSPYIAKRPMAPVVERQVETQGRIRFSRHERTASGAREADSDSRDQ